MFTDLGLSEGYRQKISQIIQLDNGPSEDAWTLQLCNRICAWLSELCIATTCLSQKENREENIWTWTAMDQEHHLEKLKEAIQRTVCFEQSSVSTRFKVEVSCEDENACQRRRICCGIPS